MAKPHSDDDDSLKPAELLASWYRANCRFALIMGSTPREWSELSEDEQAAWGLAFQECAHQVEAAENVSIATLAANANLRFQQGMDIAGGGDIVPWDEIDPRYQTKWKFLVRHMANLLVFDKSEDGSPEEHEEKIAEYFAIAIRDLGTPEEVAARDREQARLVEELGRDEAAKKAEAAEADAKAQQAYAEYVAEQEAQ